MKLEEDIKWTAKDIKNRLKARMIKPERLEIIIEDEVLELISRRCIDDKYFDEIKNTIVDEVIELVSRRCIDDEYFDEIRYIIKEEIKKNKKE